MKKSFMNRVLAVSLSAAMALSLSSATSLTAPEAAVKKLPVNNKKASISLKVGKSTTLKLKSYKAWNIKKAKSNKKAVATVKKSGANAKVKVTGKKAGKAVVTLTIVNKKNVKSKITKKVNVTVKANKDTTPTDTTPTDTTPTDTTPTTTDSAVKVTPGALNIASVTATKVDVLTVSFSSVVASTGAVKFTVTKNESTAPVETKSVEWNADANTATITMVGRMTKGTYKVTATDGKDTTEGTAEVTDQEVKEIKFLNETALTGKVKNGSSDGKDLEAGEAYVYYDVLDQYGESMRETVSIKWSPSTGVTPANDRAKGRLTLKKSDKKDFTYGEKIYVTGVYTKTGVSASGTFNVGTSQSIDTAKFAGFLKKGTTTILEKLPASFKLNQYQLLYTPLDQNGCELNAYDYIDTNQADNTKGNLTFISDNVLIIDKVEKANPVTVNGTEYCAGEIVPGTNVNVGGTLNLTAISTKTGAKSVLNTVVGSYRILKKFEMGVPADVVADGEKAEIPFTATDENGDKMTNFVELATQSDFSKLSFVAGVGTLQLEENADGSAKLVWEDNKTAGQGAWGTSSEDGIDRPVSLTSVVVGGETSNQMIYVSDKARPDSIADVMIDGVMVNGSEQLVDLNNFVFLDQYGRNMVKKDLHAKQTDTYAGGGGVIYVAPQNNGNDGSANKGLYYDNGFFTYVNQGNATVGTNPLSGSTTDFSGYNFGVSVEASGTKNYFTSGAGLATAVATHPLTGKTTNICNKDGEYDVVTGAALTGAKYSAFITNKESSGEVTLKFFIAKKKSGEQKESVSTKLSKTVKIVKLSEMSNYTVADTGKIQVKTKASNYDTLREAIKDQGGAPVTEEQLLNGGTVNNDVTVIKNQEFTVKATYNGTTIEIPEKYYDIRGDKLYAKNGSKKVDGVTASALLWKDLYDITSAQYTRKDASDTLTVKVMAQADNSYEIGSKSQTEIKKVVAISDAPSYLKDFVAADSVTVRPQLTSIVLKRVVDGRLNGGESDLADAAADDVLEIKDQYGATKYKNNHKLDPEYKGTVWNNDGLVKFTYLVKDVQENEDGYIKNNFKVNNNATEDAYIEGAERGDVFTLEITAQCDTAAAADKYASGTITKTVKVTVGSDKYSYINGSNNWYTGVTGVPGVQATALGFTVANSDNDKHGVEVQLKDQVKQLFAK